MDALKNILRILIFTNVSVYYIDIDVYTWRKWFSENIFIFDLSVPACQIIDTIHNCYRSDPTCQEKRMKFEDEVNGNRNLPRNFFIFLIYFGILLFLFIVVLYFLGRKTGKKPRKACPTVSNQQWIKHRWNRSHKVISSFQYEHTQTTLLLQYTAIWIWVLSRREGRRVGKNWRINNRRTIYLVRPICNPCVASMKETVSSVQHQRTEMNLHRTQ